MSAADQVRIVLVETTHPGNIGAVARAMKTMDLSRLVLVAPQAAFPSAEATARAAGADDILQAAQVCSTLDAALDGVERAFATTARARHLEWPAHTPRELAGLIAADASPVPTAIVFGQENAGLTNTHIDRCGGVVRIPTSDRFRSLNLAMAVQVVAYEIYCAMGSMAAVPEHAEQAGEAPSDRAAGLDEIARLHAHWLRVMSALGYYDQSRPRLLARRLHRLLARSTLRHSEVQIMRGFLTAVETRLKP